MSTQPRARGFIREKALRKRVPIAHSTLWSWVRNGRFPPPVKLSERVTAWSVADVDEWEATIAHSARVELGDAP